MFKLPVKPTVYVCPANAEIGGRVVRALDAAVRDTLPNRPPDDPRSEAHWYRDRQPNGYDEQGLGNIESHA
jgi:hypothetical protein